MTELVKLKQTGAMKELQDSFDNSLSRFSIPTNYVISIFLMILELVDPSPCPKSIYHLARLHESYVVAKAKVLKIIRLIITSSRVINHPKEYLIMLRNL